MMFAGAAGLAACNVVALPSSGVSDEAFAIANTFESFAKHFESSEALFGVKAQLLHDLYEVTNEAVEDDWDGDGAKAVGASTIAHAEAFIKALPDGLSLPELSVEPDGEIAFDWMPIKTRTLSISINESNRLSYAWIDGTDRGHGAAKFSMNVIPSRLVSEIDQITRDDSIVWLT